MEEYTETSKLQGITNDEKTLPKDFKAPEHYPADRMFFTIDGSKYHRYDKHGDKFVLGTEIWDKIDPSQIEDKDADEVPENETMIYDPEKIMFVFLRRRDG